jgi:hypothetical protein
MADFKTEIFHWFFKASNFYFLVLFTLFHMVLLGGMLGLNHEANIRVEGKSVTSSLNISTEA